MSLVINDLETRRFGIVCARMNGQLAQLPDLAEINREAKAGAIAMISTRVDAAALDRVHALEDDGYRLMDTLVYYGRSLHDPLPALPPEQEMIIRLARPDDADAVGDVARVAFHNYFGHYHSDPRLDKAAADAAYVEWAINCTKQVSPETPMTIAEIEGQVAGFLAFRHNNAEEAEQVLGAVHPKFKNRGVHSATVRGHLHFSKSYGATRAITSTVVNNYATQKSWINIGFHHFRSIYTFHKWFI